MKTHADSESNNLNYSFETDSELPEAQTTEYNSSFDPTLKVVVKVCLKEQGQLHTALNKISKLVSFVHKSTIASDVMEREKKIKSWVCYKLKFRN